jgi:hypothetical protein
MIRPRIRCYEVKGAYGYWNPTPRMRNAGFMNEACGRDGPEAWAKAEALNAKFDALEAKRVNTPRTRIGFIYFLRSGERVKIGFSDRLSLRGIDKGAGRSFPVQQLVATRGSQAEEKAIRQHLSEHSIDGEWFAVTPKVLAMMTRAAGPEAAKSITRRKAQG